MQGTPAEWPHSDYRMHHYIQVYHLFAEPVKEQDNHFVSHERTGLNNIDTSHQKQLTNQNSQLRKYVPSILE